MSLDMSKYLGVFVAESIEHLDALGRELVAVEQLRSAPPGDARVAEHVDSMFRHAHSVKGMAASMGFEPVARLAHRVEDLVDAVRSDSSRLDRPLVDALLTAVDTLLAQVRTAEAGGTPQPASELEEQLGQRWSALTGLTPASTRVARNVTLGVDPAPNKPETNPAQAPPAVTAHGPAASEARGEIGPVQRYALKLKIAPDCAVPGVRGFLVYKRLSNLGTLSQLRPVLEDIKAGRMTDGQLSLELETSAGEAGIQRALKNVPEVALSSLTKASAAPPPPPAASVAPEVAKAPSQDAQRTVRVRAELLDYFLDTVGELLLATAHIREVGRPYEPHRGPLEEAVDRLHGLVKDLHDKVMRARMTPLSVVTDRLPRAARDIARRRERELELVITGAEIELDRAIVEDLADPLLHILRNCVDHGIESPQERTVAGKNPRGHILVAVRRVRDRVHIDIEDDGRGMDPAKLKASAIARGHLLPEAAERLTDREALLLCCLPGVSTAKDISDISGRGVGMDAVKRAVESVAGTLEIDSEKGRGTRFTLKLPLTVAVVNLLLVESSHEIYGLPIGKVHSVVEATPEQLTSSRDSRLLPYESGLVPVYELSELLMLPSTQPPSTRPYVLTEGDTGKVALSVDRLLGQQEVVLKGLSRPLDLVAGLSGVTILGSGRPVFILDVPRLLAA